MWTPVHHLTRTTARLHRVTTTTAACHRQRRGHSMAGSGAAPFDFIISNRHNQRCLQPALPRHLHRDHGRRHRKLYPRYYRSGDWCEANFNVTGEPLPPCIVQVHRQGPSPSPPWAERPSTALLRSDPLQGSAEPGSIRRRPSVTTAADVWIPSPLP